MDVVITTRLHGTVFALKHGVPAIVVDAIKGGGKVYPHAKTIGWPTCFKAGEFTAEDLEKAFDFCVTQAARQQALDCTRQATDKLKVVRQEFLLRIKNRTAKRKH